MNRLLFIELKRLLRLFLPLYLVACGFLYFWNIWFILLSLPAFSVGLSSQFLKRSSWYLNLPWSRGKIILSVLYQNIVIFAINLGITCGIFYLEGKFFFDKDSKYTIILALLYCLFGLVISSARLLFGIEHRNRIFLSEAGFKKSASIFAAIVFLSALAVQLSLFHEPTFLFFLLIFMLLNIVWAICRECVLPLSSYRGVLKYSILTGLFVYSSVICTAFIAANFAKTQGKYPEIALDFLGRFPSRISEERALSLFVESGIGSNTTMLKHLKSLEKNVTAAQWKERTDACKDSGCLNLSSDVVTIEKLAPDDLENIFLYLYKFCEFSLGEDGRITCPKKRKIDQARTKKWIVTLEKEGGLNRWLMSDQPKKQIFALKGLSFMINEQQEHLIRLLGESQDPRVKTMAIVFLENLKTVRALGISCKEGEEKKHAVCLKKEKDYGM